jgi:hypothetical protein
MTQRILRAAVLVTRARSVGCASDSNNRASAPPASAPTATCSSVEYVLNNSQPPAVVRACIDAVDAKLRNANTESDGDGTTDTTRTQLTEQRAALEAMLKAQTEPKGAPAGGTRCIDNPLAKGC